MIETEHEVIQGDSFWYDYSSIYYPTFDEDWAGTWEVVTSLLPGSEIKANGDLVISQDEKSLKVIMDPTDTEAIDVGSYLLVVQAINESIGFNQEIAQDVFEVKQQGIA